MNSYELSRDFIDWSFENTEKVKPIHYAIYFFAIEQCNRLGWKEVFSLPSSMVMDAIGVKNWRTYSQGLKELVEYGFIEMIETSKNQYTANIIAIVKNTKAHTKALDKALQKHSTKHSQSTYQSTVSINKQLNNETTKQLNQQNGEIEVVQPKNAQTNYSDDFLKWWFLYDKSDAGGKKQCFAKWAKLPQPEKDLILKHTAYYVKKQPEKQYRKNPETYLNQKPYEDFNQQQAAQPKREREVVY